MYRHSQIMYYHLALRVFSTSSSNLYYFPPLCSTNLLFTTTLSQLCWIFTASHHFSQIFVTSLWLSTIFPHFQPIFITSKQFYTIFSIKNWFCFFLHLLTGTNPTLLLDAMPQSLMFYLYIFLHDLRYASLVKIITSN